jgi:hypothetical protein
MTAAASIALHHLLAVLGTGIDIAFRSDKLGDGQTGRCDHGAREITIDNGAEGDRLAAAVLYQTARIDHGPGRDRQALRETLRKLTGEADPDDADIDRLASDLGVDPSAILAALRPPRK